jgi:hypothetical protein
MWNVQLSVAARLVVYSGMCIALIVKMYRERTRIGLKSCLQAACALGGIAVCTILSFDCRRDHLMVMCVVSSIAACVWRFQKREPIPVE